MLNKGVNFFLSGIFIIFVFCFIGYNGIRYFYKPYETEVVYKFTIADKTRSKALLVRNEEVLPYPKPSGVFDYTAEDGEVVIPKTVIAKTYNNEDALKEKAKAQELSKRIESLERAQKSVVTLENIETVSSQINKSVGNAVISAKTGDLSKIPDIYESLNFFLAKRHVMNGGKNLNSYISQLSAQRDSCLSYFNDGNEIQSGESGYFSSFTDGYEETVSPDIISNMEFADIESLISTCGQAKNENLLGKVMRDHNWFAVIITEVKRQDNFCVGEKATLDLREKNCRDIPAKVSKVIYNEDNSKMAVIFECDYINSQILSKRTADIVISSKSFSGYKINQNALRFIDGKEGVYVIEGGVAVFKEVEVIYKSDNYVLCSLDSMGNSVKLFDEVIVKGKDIYNGKLMEDYR